MKLEVRYGIHTRREVVGKKDGKDVRATKQYKAGETFDGTEKELKAFKQKLKAAEQPKPKPAPKKSEKVSDGGSE